MNIAWALKLAENGSLPDSLVRFGIKRRLSHTLNDLSDRWSNHENEILQNWISELENSPIALVPEKANEQHYELPPEFFEIVLGDQLKYSSGYWPNGQKTVSDAEKAMLDLTIEHAQIENGMRILELGCGWGSLTLWMAEKFPNSKINAVSNSQNQKEFIKKRAAEKGLKNVKIIKSDMNDFESSEKFDRVVSVEMFEHMRNYKELMKRISSWLKADGKLFVHIFTHKEFAYPYVDSGPNDWMASHFFSGGQMPSQELLEKFNEHLSPEANWHINGNHYARTCRGWLRRMDRNGNKIMRIFINTYGENQAKLWFQRWRIFFMACEELFRYNAGEEWMVSHYLFANKQGQ